MTTPELSDKIERANAAYRLGNPIITDTEYDQLMEELYKRNPKHEWFNKIEPAPVGNGRKVKLPVKMKSLKKAKNTAELQLWLNSISEALKQCGDTSLIIMPKFDGLSLLYNEKTGAAYSRGGAENEGQDCTEHVKEAVRFRDITFDYTFGEIVFSRKSWVENLEGKTIDGIKYKSPRNAAAAFLNRNEPSKLAKYLTYYRYGVNDETLEEYTNFDGLLNDFTLAFSQRPMFKKLPASSLTESEEALHELYQNWSKLYYIDGLVIYVNNLAAWKTLGRQIGTENPNYAIAYKNPSFTETFETAVQDITWTGNKSGALIPVVNIDVVNTGDCEMDSPTGYNASFIFKNKIGKGAIIKVTRSGGVIPKIVETIAPASDETMKELHDALRNCPECGRPTYWDASGVNLVCINPDCPATKLAKLAHFFNVLEADSIGLECLEKISQKGFDTIAKVLNITFDELLAIDGFGESIANLFLGFNKKVKEGIPVDKLMHASDCFKGIGQSKARKLLNEFTEVDLQGFVDGRAKTNYDFSDPKFLSLDKTHQAFFMGIRPFYDFVAANGLKILPMEKEEVNLNGKLIGHVICFTGFRDKGLEDAVKKEGGKLSSSVSKTTTILVVADINSTSSKTIKSELLGVKIIEKDKFEALLQ